MASSNYEILVPGQNNGLSVIFPSASKRGVAVMSNTMGASDEQITAALATYNDVRYIGHLARNITTAGGPTTDQLLFGDGLEMPDKVGKETTVEQPEIFAVEGADYLEASTNALDANTALKTPCNFI